MSNSISNILHIGGLLLLTLVPSVLTQSCPNIQCTSIDGTMNSNNYCLQHSGDIPVTNIKLRPCHS